MKENHISAYLCLVYFHSAKIQQLSTKLKKIQQRGRNLIPWNDKRQHCTPSITKYSSKRWKKKFWNSSVILSAQRRISQISESTAFHKFSPLQRKIFCNPQVLTTLRQNQFRDSEAHQQQHKHLTKKLVLFQANNLRLSTIGSLHS